MESVLSVLPNMMYSENPFIVKKIFEYDGERENNDDIRNMAMNIKYWYASMPLECKNIFDSLIKGDVFELYQGTFLRIREVLPAHRLYNGWLAPNGSSTAIEYGVARTISEAFENKKLKPPSTPVGKEYSLIDVKNNFVFKVTSREISLISEAGSTIMVLNEAPQHALLIYTTIRGVDIIEKNKAAWEEEQYKLSIKRQIRETYSVQKDS